MPKTVRPEELDTLYGGEGFTITLYFYPVPRWYGWQASNGDAETGFSSVNDAHVSAVKELEWWLTEGRNGQ